MISVQSFDCTIQLVKLVHKSQLKVKFVIKLPHLSQLFRELNFQRKYDQKMVFLIQFKKAPSMKNLIQ